MATHTLPPPGTCRGVTATGCPSARPTRRDMLGAAGFTALAGNAAATLAKPDAGPAAQLPAVTSQDAQLFALVDQFMELQAKVSAYDADENANDEDYIGALVGAQVPLLDAMADAAAITLAGHRARARVLMKWYALGKDGEVDSELEWYRLWPLFAICLGRRSDGSLFPPSVRANPEDTAQDAEVATDWPRSRPLVATGAPFPRAGGREMTRGAYEIKIHRLDTPGDNDAGLLAALAKQTEGDRAWYACGGEADRHAMLHRWNRDKRLCLSASIAACVPKPRAGLIEKAEYALREWREKEPTPERYARGWADLATSLEHALAALAEADAA